LAALALIPVCLGISWTVIDLLARIGRASQFWVPLTVGATSWVVVFLSLPKPMWIYVVGHELTHALWALLCGGKIKRFKATSRGGHVVVTKTNLLITLSPYFFPLYACLWVLFFLTGDAIFGWRAWLPWFHIGLGAAYAFHLTLTAHILRTRQPDLESEGWVFSAVFIWLGNATVLLVALPALTRVMPLWSALTLAMDRIGRMFTGIAHW
jgi:hypothetical protein